MLSQGRHMDGIPGMILNNTVRFVVENKSMFSNKIYNTKNDCDDKHNFNRMVDNCETTIESFGVKCRGCNQNTKVVYKCKTCGFGLCRVCIFEAKMKQSFLHNDKLMQMRNNEIEIKYINNNKNNDIKDDIDNNNNNNDLEFGFAYSNLIDGYDTNRKYVNELLFTNGFIQKNNDYFKDINKNKDKFNKERLFRFVFVNYCLLYYFHYFKFDQLTNFITKKVEMNEFDSINLQEWQQFCSNLEHPLYPLKHNIIAPFTSIPKEIKYKIMTLTPKLSNNVNQLDKPVDGSILQYKVYLYYSYLVFCFILPMFVFSRLFSVFLPMISILYLQFFDGKSSIGSIHPLQWILTILHTCFLLSWIIGAIKCINIYQWSCLMYPTSRKTNGWRRMLTQNCHKRFNLVQNCYNLRCNLIHNEKLRKKWLTNQFGENVCQIILNYLPQFRLKSIFDLIEKQMNSYTEFPSATGVTIFELPGDKYSPFLDCVGDAWFGRNRMKRY